MSLDERHEITEEEIPADARAVGESLEFLSGSPPVGEEGGLRGVLKRAADYRSISKTPYGAGPVLILGGMSFFGIIGGRIFGVAGPDIIRDLEISIGSYIDAAPFIGLVLVLAAIGIAYFADRHRRVPMVAIGSILGGIFNFFTSRANSFAGLVTPQVLDSAAGRLSGVPQISLLADYYPPEHRGKVFAALGTMRNVALVAAPIGAGLLIDTIGWRAAVLLAGPPAVLLGILALFRLKEPVRGYMERKALGASEEEALREEDPVSFGEGWRSIWAIRTIRRFFIAGAVSAIGFEVQSLLLLFFFREEYGLRATELGVIGTISAVFLLFGGYLGGGLVDTFTRRRPSRVLTIIGLFQIVGAVGSLGIAMAPPIALVVAFNCIASFGAGLIGPSVSVVYVQVLPANNRTLGTALQGLQDVPAFIFGVPVAGALVATSGFQGGLLFAVPWMFAGALVALTAAGLFELDMRSALAANLASEEWRQAKERGTGKLLVCRDVDVEYDGVQVLFGVDFDVEENEIIALLGTNGAGKSTLLRAISGTQEASSGAIVVDGRDITHMPPHEIATRGVVQMPGGKSVFTELTVQENLLLGTWLEDDPEARAEGLREVFEIFPVLRERADQPAGALSGGEQQMLGLAQAFLQRPKLLLIDELSLGLSPAVVGQLLEVVREIHARGVTIVVVEQSVNVALTIADRAIFMEKGEVKFYGPTADLLARPDILRAVYVKGTGALTDSAPASAQRSARAQHLMDLETARPVLEVRDVVRRFGGIVAVDGVSLSLREGESLGIVGPNGSGKTTLFELIGGYLPLDGGSIHLDGVDISTMRPEERARLGLVRRFQDARAFPSLTVFETILVALEQRLEVKSAVVAALALPQARASERRARARADRLVDLLELGAYRDKFVSELSTGLRRIVDLACVLAAEPKVLLLDEPSSGIAQAEAEALGPLLRRIKTETGCSMLVIEHDMPLITSVADDLLALERGRVVVQGPPEVVLNDQRVIESYLGGSEEAVKRSGAIT
ncbi:MAG TPA: MFS transporter [Acidimicrobiales bacterium]|nr:MFS transporter [Acidimicrobiales bacterium]